MFKHLKPALMMGACAAFIATAAHGQDFSIPGGDLGTVLDA